MDLSFWNNKKYRYGIIGALVLACAIIALVIRSLPLSVLAGTGDMIAGPDAWYNLRLVEVLLASGGYIAFEPLTLFPTGQDVVWGPLFTYISALFAMVAGAATRVDLVTAVSWAPAVLGALMVPVMYFLGKKLGDWKTGIIAALFIAVIGGQFFSRSLYGHFDHHVAETLFSTVFCLCYVLSLTSLQKHTVDLKNKSTLKLPLLYGAVTGIAYFLGLLTMTTIVVFGFFAAVFTLIQFILDYKSGRPTEYLLWLNLLTFGIAAVGLLIHGIQELSFTYTTYSLGLFLAQILVIVGTIFLYLMTRVVTRLAKPWYYYLGSIVILAVAGTLVIWAALPDLFNAMAGQLLGFFVNNATAATVQEMASWSIEGAMSSFNWGIILAIAGFIILIWQVIRRETPAALFVLIWTLFMFLATQAHIRWEYYLAANIALLAAVCVSWAISFAAHDVKLLIANFAKRNNTPAPTEPQAKKGKTPAKQTSSPSNRPDVLKITTLVVVLIIAVAFTGISAVSAVQTSAAYGTGGGTEKDWIAACEWLSENTPETGIDYTTLYKKDGFTYPDEAYGVMSWWDYGHYITTIGDRIPNSNPFQAGVTGEYGAAAVLTSGNETAIVEKLNHLGTKYVMTDYQMAGSKFGAMTVWNDTALQISPYYTYMLQQGTTGSGYSIVSAATPQYYNTLTTRLQNFDGSYTEAGAVTLVVGDSSAGYGYPVVSYTKAYANADEAWTAADAYNAKDSNINSGKYAYVVSNPTNITDYFLPNVDVPALKHFRLVYESDTYLVPMNSYQYYQTDANGGGTAWVKTFEYVTGAVIKGEGIISIDVTTTNGRTFTYRQQSENGQFVVPYATGQTGEIKTGVYTIEGTAQTFAVSEEAVQNGLSIN